MGFAFGRKKSSGLSIRSNDDVYNIVDDSGSVVEGPITTWSEARARLNELNAKMLTEKANGSKRQRTVYPSNEIAHLWMHKAVPEARNGGRNNFYFEGDTIYSYGSHFPIARHITNSRGENAILFTTRDYSSTTSGHKSAVRSAIPESATVFHVSDVRGVSSYPHGLAHDTHLKRYADCISDSVLKAAKARLADRIEGHLESARRTLAEAVSYCEFFSLPIPTFPEIPDADTDKLAALRKGENERRAKEAAASKVRNAEAARERAAREAEAKRIAEERTKTLPARMEAWRRGENPPFYHSDQRPTMLRVSNGEVETSMGARVPVRDAKRALRLVLAVRQAGIQWVPGEHRDFPTRIGHYRIDRVDADGTLHAGCHHIPFEEIEKVIPQLDNDPTPAATDSEVEEAA